MRRIYSVIFALFTGIAVFWLTMPDVVSRIVPGLPDTNLHVSITRHVQRLHFEQRVSAVHLWMPFALWVGLMIVGWRMKRWGKAVLGVGIPIGLLGALPLIGISTLGGTSIVRFVRRWGWLDLALVGLVLVILAAKAAIWLYWWRLVRVRKQHRILELCGKIDFDSDYDYKAQRRAR